MPKKLLLLIFSLSNLYAQKQANIWYFGDHAGLDFNSGVPVALLDGQMSTNEGVATIADINGNLLFYTDGMWVYNKDHEMMQNGNGLLGDSSTSQSTVIVPKPLSTSVYYIFTLILEGYPGGLRYSEVDMSLDGGLGAVTANKNVQLITPCTEQLTAVSHANGTDIWVITHGYANNAFHAYLVTSAGVNGPVITSNSGTVFTATPAGTAGCMKVSPLGTRLGICNIVSGIQVFNFDNTTGKVSSPVLLSNAAGSYGLEFSPSGDVMYTTNENTGAITQYNLTAANIPASATVVLNGAPPTSGGSLQLGPDGKIYRAASSFSYLSVIHNPDIVGLGCNTEIEGVSLGGAISKLGLPNFIQSFFASGITAEHLCFGDATEFSILFNANEPDAISWDFGDGTTGDGLTVSHVYAAPGTYTVEATITKNITVFTIEEEIVILPPPLAHKPEDMMVCDDGTGHASFNLSLQNNIILGAQDPDEFELTYHLSQEAADDDMGSLPVNYTNISNPQIIYVRVTSPEGCHATTSFRLILLTRPVINMPDTFTICEGGSVTITAPAGFDNYLWSTGKTTGSITVDEARVYTLTVFKETEGVTCEASKNITVIKSVKPEIINVEINDWTDNDNSINITVEGGSDNEYSIDGIHYQESPVFDGLIPGRYTVYVRDKNGCGTDKEIIVLLNYPRFFTPNGDGENEMWNIKYAYFEPAMIVHVFDRYGKLINSFRGSEPGWDGRLNGHNLPSTDYWFVVERQDGKEYKGHFSMIR